MKVTHAGRQITVNVRADGDGLVSHAGSALLAQVADKTGLTRALNVMVGEPGLRAGSHDRGRVLRDLAVMLADGGDCLADLASGRRSGCPVRVHGVAVDRVSGDRSDREHAGPA